MTRQAEALDPSLTVLASLEHAAPREPAHKLKALLGRFQFQADMIHKRVEFLSGGEKVSKCCQDYMKDVVDDVLNRRHHPIERIRVEGA
jgi:hypothetical protein